MIVDTSELIFKRKFRSHFSQQKKFTKTHLAVHNIKQRECESTRAFITRYTDDTLQILGLHEEQHFRFCSLLENKKFGQASLHGPSIHLKRSNGKDLYMDCSKRDPFEWTHTLLLSASQENSHGLWEKYPWRLRLGRAPSRTNKAKKEKPSPRKERSDPQSGRRIDISGDLTRSEVPDMGIKSHGREKRQRKMEAACRLHKHKQRATYQRLIDKVFGHQMGRNMEVNADDMVIMSDSEEEMMADITETLERLWAINLKLNPKKCSFGVEEGVYSGHLITKQGIRADPSKVKVVSTLRPPRTVSEMQNLNKKIAALSRFLSKSAERTLLFMKTLKRCTSEKMVQWTKEADEAFRRMKECLESLPVMVIPTKGETLTMYLATSEAIMSAVLMAERGKKQILVYFVSRTLHGAELKYPELEKLILALVHAPRKLQRGRNSIKGKILADFLAETPLPEIREAKNKEVKRKELKPKNA
ncbi:reverse transcriptase domain-containing protein [Tanacetum coccineum]